MARYLVHGSADNDIQVHTRFTTGDIAINITRFYREMSGLAFIKYLRAEAEGEEHA